MAFAHCMFHESWHNSKDLMSKYGGDATLVDGLIEKKVWKHMHGIRILYTYHRSHWYIAQWILRGSCLIVMDHGKNIFDMLGSSDLQMHCVPYHLSDHDLWPFPYHSNIPFLSTEHAHWSNKGFWSNDAGQGRQVQRPPRVPGSSGRTQVCVCVFQFCQ